MVQRGLYLLFKRRRKLLFQPFLFKRRRELLLLGARQFFLHLLELHLRDRLLLIFPLYCALHNVQRKQTSCEEHLYVNRIPSNYL